MAVILTNMNMPKGCWGCKCMRAKDPETNYCMLSGTEFDDRLDLLTTRQKDCPLKSADEMRNEIGALRCFGDDNYLINKNLYVDGKKVLEIVDKYCYKENNNGSYNN